MMSNWDPQHVRMATAFGGGVGGTRDELCGALSGGILVIGGLHGRVTCQEDDDLAYELAKSYRRRFLDEFGDTQCAPLREGVEAPGGLDSCAQLVEQATRVLLAILDESNTGTKAR
jgi:C_GCAxxG_C_C family probable redox protein